MAPKDTQEFFQRKITDVEELHILMIPLSVPISMFPFRAGSIYNVVVYIVRHIGPGVMKFLLSFRRHFGSSLRQFVILRRFCLNLLYWALRVPQKIGITLTELSIILSQRCYCTPQLRTHCKPLYSLIHLFTSLLQESKGLKIDIFRHLHSDYVSDITDCREL